MVSMHTGGNEGLSWWQINGVYEDSTINFDNQIQV